MLKNILTKEESSVNIDFDERNAVITLAKYRMVCRLIEGRYPNYNSVIPQNNPYKITIDRAVLLSALRRVSVFLIPVKQPREAPSGSQQTHYFDTRHRLLHFGRRDTQLPV